MKTTDTHDFNPFPGLRPFTQEEDYLFFGREEQTIELLQRLGSNRFVAVVGTSGSGKSSLVRCGLLSELLGGRMHEAGAFWEIAVTHPGGNPLALLTDALLEADLYDRDEEHARENLLATLSRSHFGLVEAVKQADLGEGTNFLLVVDQFEEIFRFHEAGQTQQEVANEFVSLLLEAAAQKEVPIYVVLTMRSDFIGECGQFEGLAEMVNRGEFLIPRLTREQYKRVIEGPIKVAGGQIAPRLLQRLLNDLGQQADQLPCLQHALMRTWDVWAGRGNSEALDLDDYQRVGKMSHALSLHADEIYESLASDRQRALCQGLFQALTVEESNSRGIRRPQRLGRLCQILEVPADELLPIINAYRQSGVTFLMPSLEVELTDQTIIDISHESLMRVWMRLRQWVEEETQAAGIYHRLSESADLREQGKAGLYRDPELGIALAWRESKRPNAAWAERYRPGFATAMGFLETSQQASVAEEQAREAARQRELEQAQRLAEAQQLRLEQQQRAARKLRKLIAGVAVVAVIAAIACVAALVARNEAGKLAHIAETEAENARKNAQRAEESQQETALALTQVESQKAAVESSLTKAEKAEQVARAAEEAGRKLLYTTDLKLAPFVWRDDRSTAQQLRVLLAKHVPEERMKDVPKDEVGRMKDENERESHNANSDSSFIPHPSSLVKPDLRGFEWHYYQHLLDSSAAVFSGHDVPVAGGAFTSNDQLVTLDQNGQVRRWDLSSQQEDESSRRDLPGGPAAQSRALSPNGRLAALAEGNNVHAFDTSTGKETFQLNFANVGYQRLIFSRDSERLVIVDDKIRWCHAVSGEVIASVDQKFNNVYSLAASADGLTLAVVGHGPLGNLFSIFRLDATSQKVTPLARDIGFGGTMNASALSPDGKLIAVGAKLAGALFVFDTATGRAITQHGSVHASPVSAITFSGDGAKLATADAEGTIKIWADPQKLSSKSAALLTLKGHQGAINSIAFSSDGKWLVTSSADKTARVWDLENAGAAIRPLERNANNGSLVTRFSPDGQLIAAADGSGSVRLWDAATGRLVRELSADGNGRVFSVAFSPADNRLLAVGYGGQADVSYVALWDIDAGTELARLPGATDLPDFSLDGTTGVVGALAFSPDGKYLVAGFGSPNLFTTQVLPNPLKVWEVATRRLIRRLNGHTGYCISLDFSRDGTLLASGSRDGTAILWSTATWKAVQTLQNPDKDSLNNQSGRQGMVERVAFSPDGTTLALASREGTVQLWDVSGGKLLESLKGHSSAVNAVAFSPDGRTLASASVDQTVRLWNVQTRRELMQLDSGSVELGQVRTLAFSPDGQHLLAGGRSTAFWSTAPLVWNDPDRAAEKLRLLLQSNADFQSRIRMLSENLRLYAGLEKLDSNDARVPAALATTQANWHASRNAWPEAALAFDRLTAADPDSPEAWLRTPGLLRLATALLHQDRPRDAAALLKGGAKRRALDGLSAAADKVALGMPFSLVGTDVVVSKPLLGSPAAKAGLRQGDIIDKVNDTDLANESLEGFVKLLEGEAGTKVRLSVRRAGSAQPQVIELTRERFLEDSATGELLYPLRTAINERLAQEPHHPGLLELRAEFAGQWSDTKAQLADYTAAIESLTEKATEDAAADLQRLYGRRGHAHVRLQKWDEAVADFARVVTKETSDEDLLANDALAQAEMRLVPSVWTVPKPVNAKSVLGATLSILPDDSILAGGENPLNDKYRIDLTVGTDISLSALRLEALTHASLPGNGPGRLASGNFAFTSWNVTARSPDRKEPITLVFDKVFDDRPSAIYPIELGHWNIHGSEGRSWNAIWSTSNPVSLSTGTTLTVEVQFKSHEGVGENLGHFRLSLSSDPTAFDRESRRTAATKLTDPWQKLAAAYRLEGDDEAIDQLIDRHPKSAGLIGELSTRGKDEEKDWSRAVAIYSRGITAVTKDEGGRMKDEGKRPDGSDSSLILHPSSLLARRARAYEALKDWDASAADWSRAAVANPDGARLLADFARRLAAGDQVSLANGQFAKSQALYERSLEADPGNDVIAAELAQLLFDKLASAEPDWVVLKPADTKTESGANLTLQEDGSIVVETASTAAPETVRWQPGPQPVEALRIETSTQTVPPADGTPFFNEYRIIAASMAAAAGGLRAQFVRLDLPGDNSRFPRYAADNDKKTINLAEFQVFQGDQNIALRKKARQSSSGGESRLAPEGAVDGNTLGNDGGNPYAHTGMENGPWWEVDLGNEQEIDRIVIWNRSDVNLYARMNHFRIRMLDLSRKVVFEQVIDKAPSPSTEIVPQALLAEAKSGTAGDNQPLKVQLPLSPLKDAPARFRVSAATRLADLGAEETRLEAMKLADVTARLAAAYAINGRNDEALKRFSSALQRAERDTDKKPIIELAARFDEVLTLLVQGKPGDQHLQLALARKLAERGRQHLARKQPVEALAQLQKSREMYRRLRAESLWTVLKPSELKSNGGETFAVENDGSIFVSGPTPDRVVYSLKFQTNLPILTAIRLETIPDPRLPDGGAGRFGNGNFHLAEFTASIESGQAGAKPTPIVISSAIADAQNGNYDAKSSIDGNPRTYWDTYPKMREPHWAVFGLKSPVRTEGGALSITLDAGISPWPKHGLGRFRLSATSEAEAINLAPLRQNLKDSEVVELCVALATAYAQQGQINEAVASLTEGVDLAADRAGKAKIITAAAPLEGVLEKLALRAAGNAQFQAELARHFAEHGNTPLADAARTKARALFEQQLAKEPENSTLAVELTDLLLPRGDHWTVLKPVEMQTESGVKLELQNDGSVFVHQQKPARNDTYSLALQSELKGIRGLRLEALADSRLPGGGSGWGGGNFVLNELTLQAASAKSPDQPKSIPLRNASADFSQQGWDVRGVVDGISGTGWAVWPQTNKDHAAVFELAEAVGDERGSRLIVRLIQQHGDPTHTLGRFRLSVTADPATLDRDQKRFAANQITEPWAKLAAAYSLIDDEPAIARLLERHPAAATGIGELFAADQDWERAIAEYGKAITPQATDADLFVKRAEALEKLQLWEPAIADWGRADELIADKNKRYGDRPCLVRRAMLYERLRQHEKASADYDRALGISNAGLDPLLWRVAYRCQRGQWKQAADDYRKVWNRRPQGWFVEWYYSRERSLLNLLAGDTDGYRQAAAELLTRTEKIFDGDSSKWLAYTLLAGPDVITDANRDRLTAAAERIDPWWNPRLKAALLFRTGEFQQAADLFDRNPDGPAFQFLSAMAHYALNHPDRARELFGQGNTWLQQQRDNDPGCSSGVPRGNYWGDWAVVLQLQREAARKLAGQQLAELDARLQTEPENAAALLERARLLNRIGLDEEALADLSKVASPKTESADYLGLRGRVMAGLNRSDEALADLNQAIEAQSTDALVFAARAKILWNRGAIEPARHDLEKSLGIEPLEQTVSLLADLLLEASATEWTVLAPREMKSAGGARLTLQDDGSILASGKNPDRDDYTLVARPGVEHIIGIRLEALPDPSLPGNGPGRADNGNFHLNELRVFSAGKPCSLTGISVAFDEGQQHPNVIDGKVDETAGWGIYPRIGKSNTAVVTTRLQRAPDEDLKLELFLSRGEWKGHNLGRFRLSVSGDPAALDREQKRFAATKITNPWAKLAAAYMMNGRDDEALPYFSRALQQANGYEARKPIIELAAQFDEVVSGLVQGQPDDPQLQLALARSLAARGKTTLAAEKPAAALALLKQAQDIFTGLLAPVANWTVLKPVELQTENGAKLELQNDRSVFVYQPAKNDTYSLVFQTKLKGIKGLRLEALTDSRLPNGGPGWVTGAGNFVLNELTLYVGPAKSPDQFRSIALRNASADFSQQGWDVRGAVDGIGSTGWAVWPEVNKDHTSLFDLAEEVGDGQASRLTVRLRHQHGDPGYLLGRFRLSFTNDAAMLQAARIRLDLKDGELADLKIALASAYVALAKAHAQQDHTSEAMASFTEALRLATDRAGKARIIAAAAPLEGVLEQLTRRAAGDGSFQAELARHFAEQGNTPLANAARAKARALFEKQLAAEPENPAPASELADLLWSTLTPVEQFWIDDAAPVAANLQGDTPWEFVSQPDHPVFSGEKAMRRRALGLSQHYFDGAIPGLKIGEGAKLFAYAYLDPQDPPKTVMLQFKDGSWEHRAYWGEDLISFGAGGKENHLAMGPLPKAGEWVRLEVEAKNVGLRAGAVLNGWAFTQHGGTCYWDAAGCTNSFASPWQQLAAAYHLLGDHPALDKLIERHPDATAGIGDLYALKQDWERAIAEYTRAITAGTRDARIFAARAEAYEKLANWELAADDWGNADLSAPDKKGRYGNPSFPCLEHRAHIHGRLQQYDQQVLDYAELLKPERLGDNPWMFAGRGEAYGQLRQWHKARADHDQAVKVSAPTEQGYFQYRRGNHFAAQGLWKEAADDIRLAYQNPPDSIKNWANFRDAAFIYAMAGDVENCRKVAADCFSKQSVGNPNPDENKWIVLAMLLSPDMITNENRPGLLEMAGKTDPYWQPRLTAAIYFRGGEYDKALELFQANPYGPQFAFLAAMNHQKLGNQDRAKQLLDEGNSWIREQLAKDPGAGVPQGSSWQDWANILTLQYEGEDLILGPGVGAPRKLALQGQTAQSAQAYATALAEAADQDSKSRIIDELAQFDDILAALRRLLPDDPQIQQACRRMVERGAGPNATAASALLVALDRHRRKEKDQARRAYRKAVAALQPVGENAFIRELVREALREFGLVGPEAEVLLTAVVGESPAALTQAIQNQPDQAAGYLARAEWYGRRGLWRKAADDYAAAYRLRPEVMIGMQVGMLLAWIGETDRYRAHCLELADRVAGTTDNFEAERTLKACCLLGPSPVGDPTRIARLAEVAASGDTSQPVFVWLDLAKGLYEYRVGRFDAAVATSLANRTRIKAVGGADAAVAAVFAVEALALHRAGDADGARRSLDEAKKLIDEKFLVLVGGDLEGDWHNWLAAQLLYREAKALLENKKDEPKK